MTGRPPSQQTNVAQQHQMPPMQQQQSQSQTSTLLSPMRLRELLASVAENEAMDPLVETALLRMADEFAMDVVRAAVELTAYRRSSVLAPKDILHVLKSEHGMQIAGWEAELGGLATESTEGGLATPATANTAAQQPRRKSARTTDTNTQQPQPQQQQQQQDVHANRMAKIRQLGHNR